MTRESSAIAMGFVTAMKTDEVGFVGGLLVVNSLGRPLEFHATTPIRPSRAHEILYGPTLNQSVMGERIAGTLIESVKSRLSAVLTDLSEIAAGLANHKSAPLCVSFDQSQSALDTSIGQLRVNGWLFTSPRREPLDAQRSAFEAMQIEDWHEPFDRIREALEEAQKSVRAAAPRRVGEAA